MSTDIDADRDHEAATTDGLPESFDALTRVCISCGEDVARRYLDDGLSVTCRERRADR